MATFPAPLDVRLIPPHLVAACEDPSWARGWAEATLRRLGPPASEPDRQLICRALAAAGPAIGDRATVRWGTGRDRHTWTGVVVGRYPSGFTLHVGRYRRFVSVIDLWARHAFLDEPSAARARVQVVLQLLQTRMPKPGGTIRGMPDEARQGG